MEVRFVSSSRNDVYNVVALGRTAFILTSRRLVGQLNSNARARWHTLRSLRSSSERNIPRYCKVCPGPALDASSCSGWLACARALSPINKTADNTTRRVRIDTRAPAQLPTQGLVFSLRAIHLPEIIHRRELP